MKKYKFYFLVGSQHLYGDETLKEVDAHAKIMADGFNADPVIPCTVEFLPCVTTSKAIEEAGDVQSPVFSLFGGLGNGIQ